MPKEIGGVDQLLARSASYQFDVSLVKEKRELESFLRPLDRKKETALMRPLAFVTILTVACATGYQGEVREAERARFQAMVQNDLAAVAQLLSDDLVYVHSAGEVESKQQFLERLRSGALRYRSIEPADVVVRLYGRVAVVTGRAAIGVTMGGSDRDLTIRYTSVYRATGDGWKLVSWQSTRLQP